MIISGFNMHKLLVLYIIPKGYNGIYDVWNLYNSHKFPDGNKVITKIIEKRWSLGRIIGGWKIIL